MKTVKSIGSVFCRALAVAAFLLFGWNLFAIDIVNLTPEQFPGRPVRFEVVGGLPPTSIFLVPEWAKNPQAERLWFWVETDGFTGKFILRDDMTPGKYFLDLTDDWPLDHIVTLVVAKPSPPAIIHSVSPQIVRPGDKITIKGMQFDEWNILLYSSASGIANSETDVVQSINGTINTTVPTSLKPGYYRIILDNRCGNLSKEEIYIYIPTVLGVDGHYVDDSQGMIVWSKQIDGRVLFIVITDPPGQFYPGDSLPTQPSMEDLSIMVRAQRTAGYHRFSTTGITYGWKLLWLYDPGQREPQSNWSQPILFFHKFNFEDRG